MYTADVHVCLYCKYMHRRRKRKYRHTIWQSIINTWRESRSFVILHARGIAIRCTKRRLFFGEMSHLKRTWYLSFTVDNFINEIYKRI